MKPATVMLCYCSLHWFMHGSMQLDGVISSAALQCVPLLHLCLAGMFMRKPF